MLTPSIHKNIAGSAGRIMAQIRRVESVCASIQECGLIRKLDRVIPDGDILLIHSRSQTAEIPGGALYAVSSALLGFSGYDLNSGGMPILAQTDEALAIDDAPAALLFDHIQAAVSQQVKDLVDRAIRYSGKAYRWLIICSDFYPGEIEHSYLWFNKIGGGEELLWLLCQEGSVDPLDLGRLRQIIGDPDYAEARSAIGTDRILKGGLDSFSRTAARKILGATTISQGAVNTIVEFQDLEFWLRLFDSTYQVYWSHAPQYPDPAPWSGDRAAGRQNALDKDLAHLLGWLSRLPELKELEAKTTQQVEAALLEYEALLQQRFRDLETSWLEGLEV